MPIRLVQNIPLSLAIPELESGRVELKDMANSEKSEVALADLPAILKEKCGK